MIESPGSDAKLQGSNRLAFLCCVLLLFLGVLAYGSTLQAALFFDDIPNLVSNDFVKIDGTRFDDWRTAVLSSGAGVTRRPLAMLTFVFNYVLAGEFVPWQMKAVNLFIHCILGLLIYGFSRAVLDSPLLAQTGAGQKQLIALLAAAIWFLHPLHVSTVLYSIQRMAQLPALFTVAGLLVFCRYRLRWAQSGAEPGEVFAAALWLSLLCFLALFSKENGALLPWLIIVVEVTLFRGVWQQRQRPVLVKAGWLFFSLPFLGMALFFVVNPEWFPARYSGREFTFEERLLTQCRMLWHYLYWLLVPDVSAMGFMHDDIRWSRSLVNPSTTWIAIVGWLLLLISGWVWRAKFPLLLFGVLFYLVGHSMESSVWPLEMVYEHRNYLPSVGVSILVAGVIGSLANRVPQLRFEVAAVGVLVILVIFLFVRTQVWSDELLRSRVNVVNHPLSPRSHFFYGHALFQQYLQRNDLGLDADEERDLAVASRHHFQKMYEIDSRDTASIVMLHQIDSMLFSDMPGRVDWLEKLELVLQSRPLQASDQAALAGMVSHFSHAGTGLDRQRFSSMLDQLIERYKGSAKIQMHKYNLLAADDSSSSEMLLNILQSAYAVTPGYLEIYPYQMIEYDKKGDYAAIYELSLEWMRQDPRRMQLPALRHIFSQQ